MTYNAISLVERLAKSEY